MAKDVQKISELRKVIYATSNFTTGLSDLIVEVRKPDGSTLTPAPTVTEQADGLYSFEYTPDAVGVWQEKITSVTNGDKAIRSYDVVAVDMADVKTQTDSIEGKVDTVDGKVDAVDGKVDTVQSSVNTVDGKVDGIKAKTDGLPADSAQEFTDIKDKQNTIEGKIDSIDTEISPGGKFV